MIAKNYILFYMQYQKNRNKLFYNKDYYYKYIFKQKDAIEQQISTSNKLEAIRF